MKKKIKISSGMLKGKKIVFGNNQSLRPTTSKLKEILFDWIQFEISGTNCLDLFAGSGSIGIEAISRGAKKLVFVEINKKNFLNLNKTIQELQLKNLAKIFLKDAFILIKNFDLSDFDFIFLDPPFSENYEEKILKFFSKYNKLKSSCKIYLEHSKFININMPKNFSILKEKNIGDVRAILIQKNGN